MLAAGRNKVSISLKSRGFWEIILFNYKTLTPPTTADRRRWFSPVRFKRRNMKPQEAVWASKGAFKSDVKYRFCLSAEEQLGAVITLW